MSKAVKQMQMDVLAKEFQGVRDMVFLTAKGVDAQADNTARLGLRKKNIRLQMVKNSLLRRVFGAAGVTVPEAVWAGTTIVAWGGESVKGLSKEIEAHLIRNDKMKNKVEVKSVLADGQPVTFAQALVMPTRLEAIGEIIAAAMGPAGSIASALTSPAAQVASQIQKISERTEGEAAPSA
jgi:large subunit ribosomal protein L10